MQLIESVLAPICKILNAAFLAVIVVLFSMCNAGDLDFNNIETPNLASHNSIVVGQTTYKIGELISELEDPNIEITEDNSNLLSVTYRDTTQFNDLASIITLQDVSNPGNIEANSTPIAGSPSDQDVTIPTQNLSFEYTSPNSEELDSVIYSAGTIALDIQNGYAVDVEYELTLSDIVDTTTGDALVLSGTLPASGTDNASASLAGYKTIINYDAGTNTNLFAGLFDGVLKVQTGDFINGTEIIDYTLAITNAEFSTIFGWFGSKNVDIESQTITLDFFEGISENNLVINNPQLNFYIDNSFGVPMGLDLAAISASNSSGTSVNLAGDVTDSPQLVRAPSTSQVGQSAASIIQVDESNSNMRDLLAISPNTFTLDVSAVSNYNNDDGSDRNFVTTTSQVDIVMELNIPLNVKMQNVSRDFYTGIEGFEFEDADTIRLVLTTDNGFPFGGTIDMQFMDADSTVIFEYPDVQFMESPEIPVSGKIEESVITKSTIPVYRGNGYQELLDASIVNFVTNFSSADAENDNYVKLFSDYEMTLKLGVQVNVNYEF